MNFDILSFSRGNSLANGNNDFSFKGPLVKALIGLRNEIGSNMSNLRYLDLGCGSGGKTKEIGEFFGAEEIYGIDISDGSIRRARRKGIKAEKCDLNQDRFPFDDNHFSLITADQVFEHLLNPDNVLEECKRVLKPGGFLIIGTPNLGYWLNRIYLLLGFQPPDVEISTSK